MNSKILALALDAMDDSYLEDARIALGYTIGKNKGHKSVWRTVFLAAVISALFCATAYATGWFGLASRLSSTTDIYHGESAMFFSVDDYAGTPTAEAGREWKEFRDEYAAEHTFTNSPFHETLNEPEKSYSMIYGAHDQEMLDKLIEISQRHGVKLHTKIYPALNYEDGLTALGISDFIRGDADRSFKYIFEDGSFTVESYIHLEDMDVIFSLMRCQKGTLNNGFYVFNGTEIYDEWEYISKSGNSVVIAVNDWNKLTTTVPIFFLYDAGDYLVTVRTECPNGENIRANAEELAERFDFDALTGGELNMSILDVQSSEPAQARPVKPKTGLMTVSEFFDTDEYKASVAFQREFSEYYNTEVCTGIVPGLYDSFFYGAYPAKDERVNEILERVLLDYPGLTVPSEAYGLIYMVPIEADRLRSYASYTSGAIPAYVYEPVSMEDLFNTTGMHPFTAEADYSAVAHDTGAFWLANDQFQLSYIPKGSFFPTVRFALDENGKTWAYETACGEQVSIALGGEYEYPVWAYNYALYETESAYVLIEFPDKWSVAQMEDMLDGIDFTKFNSPKPWSPERKIIPRYIPYEPLTIMRENWYTKDEYLISFAETERSFFTYEALAGADTEGITWSIDGSENITLKDNGDGSCTIVTHGTEQEVLRLTASRGNDSFSVVIICENYQ